MRNTQHPSKELLAEEKELLQNGCTLRELYTLRAKHGQTEELDYLNKISPEKIQSTRIQTFKLKEKKRIVMVN